MDSKQTNETEVNEMTEKAVVFHTDQNSAMQQKAVVFHVDQNSAMQQNDQNMVSQDYVSYKDYSGNKLSANPAEQKVVPGTGPAAKPPCPPQNYYQIPLMYNFGNDSRKLLKDFVIEGPEMSTAMGILTKEGQGGKIEYSIMSKFDENNQSNCDFIDTMNKIHSGVAYILHQMKGSVKLFTFNHTMAEATGLKNPVYRPRDDVTGEPIQGRPPSMFLKLFSRGKQPLVEQTLFTDVSGKPISWALMKGVEMTFIPCIHIKRIYVGSKASIQMEVLSAVVTSIRARGTSTKQTNTLRRLQDERPELADTVAAQLAKLTLDRQDQLMAPTVPQTGSNSQGQQGNTSQSQSNQPTFAGITPNRQFNPLESTSTSTNTNTTIPNMESFTASAPPRGTTPGSQAPLQFN